MNEHTPVPWLFLEEIQKENASQIRGLSGEEIAFDVYTPNAELICRAVNAHKDLVIALDRLSEWGREHTSPRDKNSPHDLLVAAVAALEKAKGAL